MRRRWGGRSLLHVTLQQEHDGRVALRRLLELVQRDLVVVVFIHFAEDLVYPLLWCQTVLVHLHHDHRAHHFVDGLQRRSSKELAVFNTASQPRLLKQTGSDFQEELEFSNKAVFFNAFIFIF